MTKPRDPSLSKPKKQVDPDQIRIQTHKAAAKRAQQKSAGGSGVNAIFKLRSNSNENSPRDPLLKDDKNGDQRKLPPILKGGRGSDGNPLVIAVAVAPSAEGSSFNEDELMQVAVDQALLDMNDLYSPPRAAEEIQAEVDARMENENFRKALDMFIRQQEVKDFAAGMTSSALQAVNSMLDEVESEASLQEQEEL